MKCTAIRSFDKPIPHNTQVYVFHYIHNEHVHRFCCPLAMELEYHAQITQAQDNNMNGPT